MKRRRFLESVGLGALALTARPAMAWGAGQRFEWHMATAWPRTMPILQTGAQRFADLVRQLSGNRLTIRVYAADELVRALDVFEAVSTGKLECGHAAAYYWEDKAPAAQWFATVPFGLTAQEMNTWYYAAGGRELWQEIYADHNLVPMLAGNTGVQMGGWFNRKIQTVGDFAGLRMRIPGLGGKVVSRLDAEVVLLPAGDIVQALKDGKISAAEWIGPYHDTEMGFPLIAKYYYGPGWHEPGTAFEMIFNRKAYDKLPAELKAVLPAAAAIVNDEILSAFEYHDAQALIRIARERNVQLRLFPQKILRVLARLSLDVLEEEAARDQSARKVHTAYKRFKNDMRRFSLLRGSDINL